MNGATERGWRLRAAVLADIAQLQRLEIDAGRRFRDLGMDAIADDEPPTVELLSGHIVDGTAWVVVDAEDLVLGYALASMVDDEGHLDQVSVAEHAGRRGIGTALIGQVCSWTRQAGASTVTLTTFRDVGFNGPYYASLGFVEIDEAGCGPELRAIRRSEREHGLDIAPRVAMRRSLSG
jgi:GNAT superfamily N-acetyltransferase